MLLSDFGFGKWGFIFGGLDGVKLIEHLLQAKGVLKMINLKSIIVAYLIRSMIYSAVSIGAL